MKHGGKSQTILIALLLIVLSIVCYVLHFVIFRDAHHIFIYMVGDIAFVFVEVLLVTVIIHQLLNEREKRTMLKKLNMVIGAFFSEVGTPLLEHCLACNSNADSVSEHLMVDSKWSAAKFNEVRADLAEQEITIDVLRGDVEQLRDFIISRRSFLLSLLENPNLLEHESFTELLWAVFHVAEELSYRKTLEGLPETDYLHLSGDVKRAYVLLLREWLFYMEHLKSDYPYLFSLAVRTNPFDAHASVEVV